MFFSILLYKIVFSQRFLLPLSFLRSPELVRGGAPADPPPGTGRGAAGPTRQLSALGLTCLIQVYTPWN